MKYLFFRLMSCKGVSATWVSKCLPTGGGDPMDQWPTQWQTPGAQPHLEPQQQDPLGRLHPLPFLARPAKELIRPCNTTT